MRFNKPGSSPCLHAGVMYAEGNGPAGAPAGALRTFTEAADVRVPGVCLSSWCPGVVTTLVLVRQLQRFTLGLADAADVMVGSLSGAGEFSRKRVGLTRGGD